MHFEVVLLLNGKEVTRYRFSALAPVDFRDGVGNAIEKFLVDPEVDVLADGVLVQVQKAGR